ncbi:hypothetical protein M1N22_02885 [Dehalococcoidia bacterium]|nr:hypothetical protein [Dehalococcoidia bacterium]
MDLTTSVVTLQDGLTSIRHCRFNYLAVPEALQKGVPQWGTLDSELSTKQEVMLCTDMMSTPGPMRGNYVC